MLSKQVAHAAQREVQHLSTASARQEFRHLLRKLLRAASYLPDAHARNYYHAHILHQFRSKRIPYVFAPTQEALPTGRTALLLRRIELFRSRAHDTFRLLAGASLGIHELLNEVLQHAYGRIGPQRARLLAPYLRPDEPTDDAALQSAIVRRATAASKAAHDMYAMPAAVYALAEAQRKHKDRLQLHNKLRNVELDLPATNRMGRSMPLKRVRNARKRHLRRIVNKILPPLPESQWIHLQRLASGETVWTGLPRERPAAPRDLAPPPDQSLLPDAALLRRDLLRGRSVRHRRSIRTHAITPRFMRRRYCELFQTCPVIRRTPGGKWEVEFGNIKTEIPTLTTAERSPIEEEDGE